jgi:non-ribosomal peptide synthetase component E (peptide arylation enzyme)
MVQGFADKYGVQIINYFGSNEGAALAGSDIEIPEPALRAQYFPRAGVPGFDWRVSTTRKIKTRLVDLASGADISQAGQPGELRFKGPTVFSGYFKAPDMTTRAFDEQGFYRTGDLFEIGGEQLQYYRHVGRSKDLVIRGGMNISSEEVEGLLAGCPGIKEVAVVGVPDRILGEKLCACVVYAGPQALSLAELLEFLKQQRVAAFKLPEYLLALPALPRNPLGKILKRELREQARALAPETV